MQSILFTELALYMRSLYYSPAHCLASSGYIGKLKLKIPPVHYIKSQPWVVRINQLYVVAGPPQPSDVSPRQLAVRGYLCCIQPSVYGYILLGVVLTALEYD